MRIDVVTAIDKALLEAKIAWAGGRANQRAAPVLIEFLQRVGEAAPDQPVQVDVAGLVDAKGLAPRDMGNLVTAAVELRRELAADPRATADEFHGIADALLDELCTLIRAGWSGVDR